MRLKEQIKRLMPTKLVRAISLLKMKRKLALIQKLQCDSAKLSLVSDVGLKEVFTSSEVEWSKSKGRLAAFTFPDLTGGVNPGDRRAIYYRISRFRPSSVLEIGTHIGTSTLYIAEALYSNQKKDNNSVQLVTVDIKDVNDTISKPWLKFDATHSPLELINEMGFGNFVKFVKDASLNYLRTCEQKFDFIFLDGDHGAATVYEEIPAALKLLKKDGLLLLHDYFPDLKPLWSNREVIPGPFLATERFREEGANLAVLPLGELPWPTKFQSNITSLALLLRGH